MRNRITAGVAVLVLTVFAALLVFFAAAQTGGPATVNAQQATSDANSGISVNGQGKVSLKPNIAIANIGVDITTVSLTDATAQSNSKMTAVIDKLKSLGIDEKDIQTTNYSLYPITQQPPKPDGSGTPGITGYRVSNQVRVTIRKIADVGKALDAAVGAGANNIYGVTFGVDDLTPYQQQARAAAIKDAQDKATQLAKTANIQLGPVIAISEGSQSPSPIRYAATAFSAAGASDVPVQTGEMQVTVDVTVRFGIK